MLQQVMSQIAAVKKDMIILEKSEFSTLLAESEVGAFPFAGKFRCVGALCCFCGEPLFLVFVFFPFYFTETQAPAIPAQSSTCCRFILFYSQLDLFCFVFCIVISSREGVLCRAVVCLSSLCVTLLQDVMEKVRSDSLLDMNLEKSRVKELVSYVNLENYFYEVL